MWIKLTPELLKTHLAEQEIATLATVAKPFDVDLILTDECHNVAEAWRGRIRQYHSIDRRKDYIPSELLQFILAHLRYSSFTRLPNMESLLDDLRVEEWKRANEIFDNPKKINLEDPEESEEESNGLKPVVYPNPRLWRVEEVRICHAR